MLIEKMAPLKLLLLLLLCFSTGWFGRTFIYCNEKSSVEPKSVINTESHYYQYFNDRRDGKRLSIEVELVTLPKTDLNEEINREIRKKCIETLFPNEYDYEGFLPISDIIASNIDELRQSISRKSPPWDIQVKYTPTFVNSYVVSYELYSYNYTGGDQSNETMEFNLFSAHTGEEINAISFFDSTKSEQLLKLAEREFRVARDISPNESLKSRGFRFENGFKLAKNIGFRKTGIILYYNLYEIAPFIKGPTEFQLKKEDVSPLLKDEYRKLWDINVK